MLLKHSYFCLNCYDNKENLAFVFRPGDFAEIENYKCFNCGNPNITKMALTDEDVYTIINTNRDPDFILSFEYLKRDKIKNLDDEEFAHILKVSLNPNFILAMDKLKQDDIIDFNLKLSQMKQVTSESTSDPQQSTTNIPKCPTCGSTRIRKISAAKRWFGVGTFGLASSDVGKTMQCNNCGYKF